MDIESDFYSDKFIKINLLLFFSASEVKKNRQGICIKLFSAVINLSIKAVELFKEFLDRASKYFKVMTDEKEFFYGDLYYQDKNSVEMCDFFRLPDISNECWFGGYLIAHIINYDVYLQCSVKIK